MFSLAYIRTVSGIGSLIERIDMTEDEQKILEEAKNSAKRKAEREKRRVEQREIETKQREIEAKKLQRHKDSQKPIKAKLFKLLSSTKNIKCSHEHDKNGLLIEYFDLGKNVILIIKRHSAILVYNSLVVNEFSWEDRVEIQDKMKNIGLQKLMKL